MAVTARSIASPTSLKRRIRQFYTLLNDREFARCHRIVDPQLRRRRDSVTLYQYEQSLRDFVMKLGPIEVLSIDVELHAHEPTRGYEGRDFAVGQTVWADCKGRQHAFQERWGRDGRTWCTRSTGFVVPEARR
jgi:hypothetical protein